MSRLNQSHKRSWVFFLTFFCSLKLVERIISSLQLGENLPVKFFVPIWSHLLSPSTVNSFFSNVTSPLRVAGTCWESVCAEVLFRLFLLLGLLYCQISTQLLSPFRTCLLRKTHFDLQFQANHSIQENHSIIPILLLPAPVQNFPFFHLLLFIQSLFPSRI